MAGDLSTTNPYQHCPVMQILSQNLKHMTNEIHQAAETRRDPWDRDVTVGK